jgi:hypothetical protein
MTSDIYLSLCGIVQDWMIDSQGRNRFGMDGNTNPLPDMRY